MCIKSLFGTNIKPLSISAARAFVKRRNVITHRNFSRDGNTKMAGKDRPGRCSGACPVVDAIAERSARPSALADSNSRGAQLHFAWADEAARLCDRSP
jgi:hypothetical protein